MTTVTVGVLALQGAFAEHIQLLRRAALSLPSDTQWTFIEVRTAQELDRCAALIIPGGESTTMALVAARSNLLEPLRSFVKVRRKPTWGTCAGLILLAESANRTKRGGQELIGGLDVRVNRNHFGRQAESFEDNLDLPFLAPSQEGSENPPFKAIFIRAPVVERILPPVAGVQADEELRDDTVVAPSRTPEGDLALGEVEIMATLPGRSAAPPNKAAPTHPEDKVGDIIAVRQGNVFGTSFHPELTGDCRIHAWWLRELETVLGRT
ncbi:MAG: hypothetical protein M1832_002648 [Thelocarpon impressellum]|nr:MAG: hypothetical protein M1832_002648 [Thelocarpon impressellum]